MATSSCAHAHSPAAAPAAILYEHSDGRRAVVSSPQMADFAAGDPSWHRAGPVDIVRLAAPAAEIARPSFHAAAQFKPFAWVHPDKRDSRGQRYAAFLNVARDAVSGAHTLAQLLAWDEDQRDFSRTEGDPAPVLDAFHRGSLERFLAASLEMLHAQIVEQCDGLNGERDHA